MSKSHVSLEAKVCPCCGHKFQTNSILLDKRLRPSMKPETVTGYQNCESCQGKFDEGYLGLVEALDPVHGTRITVDSANRTGRIAFLKKSIAAQVFKIPLRENMEFVFVDQKVIKALEGMQKRAEAAPEN
jgi:hypothetical protein